MSRKTLSTLQSFRGVAAILVLLYHVGVVLNPAYKENYLGGVFSPFGAFGVDFFFVLSGFIIFYAHSSDLGSKKLIPYLKKRFMRIYPIYWMVTLPIIPLLFLFPALGTQGTETEFGNIMKSVILFPNQTPPVLGVAWTLTHEVFFYLVFGLIFIMLKPKYAISVAAVWVVITLFSFVNMMNLKDLFYMDFIFNAYNLEFVMGMVSGYLVSTQRIPTPKIFLTIGIVLFALAGIDKEFQIVDFHRVASFGIASFFLVCGAAALDINSKVNTPKMMKFLGDASYSIYLTHYPVIILLSKVITAIGVTKLIGAGASMHLIAAMTLIVGCLFHVIIEKPLLRTIRTKVKKEPVLMHAA